MVKNERGVIFAGPGYAFLATYILRLFLTGPHFLYYNNQHLGAMGSKLLLYRTRSQFGIAV